MNKTAIKNFAIWARRKLISEITYKAGLIGISEKGISKPLEMSTDNIQFFDIGTEKPTEILDQEIKQRNALIKRIKEKESTSDYKTAFQFIVEEVAYTWFNRLIAIRFMEVNDYLPSRIRVLSSETQGKSEPDMVTIPFDTDMEFSPYETDKIMQFKDENKLDELFRMLFIKQCNKLNEVLPALFEKTADYTELLLTISFTDSDDIVSHLVNDIEEEDFTEAVEIIGWMYQYYISEPKDVLINARRKYKNENVPFVTQLFTSDWIVKYMVDNSLGRYWIERNPNSKLAEKLEYFIIPKNVVKQYVDEKVILEELTFLDPCMGSGHILVYAFDVLMEIYRECGYVDRDAVQSIIVYNLFGLDIDERAYQLAYFSLMMKARSYDRRFLTREIDPKVYCPNGDNDCSNFGSLLIVDSLGEKPEIPQELILFNMDFEKEINNWNYKKLLSQKYTIICTNSPYMNGSYMPTELKKYVVKEYKDYKSDLFSAFMVRELQICKDNGYVGMLTPYVWMFISSYEKLRAYILSSSTISSLVQLEYNAFEGACVPVCSFVLKKTVEVENGEYIKLSDFKGTDVQAPKTLEAISNPNCGYRYSTKQENFSKIPGSPIAYWVSEKNLNSFTNKLLDDYAYPKQGFATGKNERFLRIWTEVSIDKCIMDCNSSEESKITNKKWYPCNKGGSFRRWYGNNIFLANWQHDGCEMRAFNGSVIRNPHFYFSEGMTWSTVTSGKLSMRYSPKGFVFETKGSVCFSKDKDNLLYLLGALNTEIVRKLLLILSPTLDYHEGPLGKIPIIISNQVKNRVDDIVKENIQISKNDWNSFETSWDFEKHSILNGTTVESGFENWQKECDDRFNRLKSNEEELNRIFIDIYGLQDELTPEVEVKDITVNRIYDSKDVIPESMKGSKYVLTKQDVVKSFISYAIGCMFGRYSFDVEGLAYAGGEWDDSKYSTFVPDKDNCIPITDEEYFEDDIVGLFVSFIKKAYGTETLEENLDFIANVLGNKGNTSMEIIRNYFIKDFYKDHIKTYKKRPIYWLYDSGKKNGFKALIYMHRYTADTTGSVRVDYLHRMQKIYMSEIDRMQDLAQNSTNAREATQAEKRKEKLVKQLKETKEYDEKIAHLALSRIEIDLDDGVKVNYEKVQTSQDGKKLNILGKI